MALFKRKQELTKRGEIKQGPPKEKEPDTSPFKGRPYFPRQEFERWLKSDQAWQATRISAKERLELASKIFSQKKIGEFIEKGESERIKRELVKGKYGEFKDLNPIERSKLLRIYKGFFEKKKL